MFRLFYLVYKVINVNSILRNCISYSLRHWQAFRSFYCFLTRIVK
nr:MAG TPA: hypothetical protein [Caudoviricetes sp.]